VANRRKRFRARWQVVGCGRPKVVAHQTGIGIQDAKGRPGPGRPVHEGNGREGCAAAATNAVEGDSAGSVETVVSQQPGANVPWWKPSGDRIGPRRSRRIDGLVRLKRRECAPYTSRGSWRLAITMRNGETTTAAADAGRHHGGHHLVRRSPPPAIESFRPRGGSGAVAS